MCGGTSTRPAGVAFGIGLSPRVRGNLVHRPLALVTRRSIPACAGEPGVQALHCRRSLGLSPRVRGNRQDPRRDWNCIGSIPACAGEPQGQAWAAPTRGVYPRVCGGTAPAAGQCAEPHGLSPRVRENPLHALPWPLPERSIPACAGEPGSEMSNQSMAEVYPRVCGGTVSLWLECNEALGLSPRVRGNL